MAKANEPTVIKKYANRRLYNTGTSTYVTLEDLAAMIKAGEDFVVVDARSDDDISHQVLTQIVLELEGRAHRLLPPTVLRQLIALNGDGFEAAVPGFLERALGALMAERQRVRDDVERDLGTSGSAAGIDDHIRRHPDLVARAVSRLLPAAAAGDQAPPRAVERHSEEFDLLRTQIEALQRRLDRLAPDGDAPPQPN